MNLSHSKLTCILNCPMTYYLNYKMGITLKEKKPALEMGSAIHWGIEHNTSDLTEYYDEHSSDFKKGVYTDEQQICEAIVKNYLNHHNQIFDKILTDENGEKLQLIKEYHELKLVAPLKSFSEEESHSFLGIIDLLLLTNKGFIIIDYKTSSRAPNFDDYIEQIYRYCFLLHENFPNTPILKIGVVNLRKLGLRKKVDETDEMFMSRLMNEYESKSDELIIVNIYEPEKLDQDLLTNYIANLSRMADTAAMIDESGKYYINYANAVNQYGKSDYYDIFYHKEDAYLLYNITDHIYNEQNGNFIEIRECVPIDMMVIDNSNVLNKYEQFKANAISYYSILRDIQKKEFFDYLKTNFICDNTLLELYWKTLNYEIKNEIFEM